MATLQQTYFKVLIEKGMDPNMVKMVTEYTYPHLRDTIKEWLQQKQRTPFKHPLNAEENLRVEIYNKFIDELLGELEH